MLLSVSCASYQGSLPAKTDAEIKTKIVGTWIRRANDVREYMEKTYRPDGTSKGFLFDEVTGQRVYFTSSWEIRKGYLRGKVLTSTEPVGLPVGKKYSDKIIRVTNEEFVTIEEGLNRETIKHRKRRFFFF